MPTRASIRIPAELQADIVRGRAALANRSLRASANNGREQEAIARLLELLWHSNEEVRRAAALALPGGDGHNAHIPHFGHFIGAFLRGLEERGNGQSPPLTPSARYACVADVLRALLAQNIGEIRGLGNMNYSFLSSGLYLAVFATCRDVLLAVRRLQAAQAQAELCSLLTSLPRTSLSRRLNGADVYTLARLAGQGLAALPPDQIPAFWHGLTQNSPASRISAASALAYFEDKRAVPYLLDTLQPHYAQFPSVVIPVVACLARLEDGRALPLLQTLSSDREKSIRTAAQSALAAIQKTERKHPARTLLRATHSLDNNDFETMLRPVPVNHHNIEPPEEMLRPVGSPPVRRARYE